MILSGINKIKIFKFIFVIPVITLIIIFQTSLHNRYLMASDIRDGESINEITEDKMSVFLKMPTM